MRAVSGTGRTVLAVLVVALLSVVPASAQDWTWSLTPYLWASDISLDVNVNGTEIIDGKVEFSDLLDAADFAFMAHFEGRKDKIGLLFDFITLDLGDDLKRFENDITAEGDMEMTVIELGGSYAPQGEGDGWSVVFGARMTDVDQEIDIFVPLPAPQQEATTRLQVSETLYDGFAGLRYLGSFGDGWSVNVRGDLATGGTEFTWNAIAGLGYHFGNDDRYGLLFGYRYMDMELDEADENASVESEIVISGAYLGFEFVF